MKRIMALIDFSELTSEVTALGRNLSRAFGSELVLLNIVESKSDFVDDMSQQDMAAKGPSDGLRRREMEILSMELKKEGINVITHIAESTHMGVGEKILQEVSRLAPDLIVMGSHGHGRLHQLLCGSVTDVIMRKAACPVAIVPRAREKVSGR